MLIFHAIALKKKLKTFPDNVNKFIIHVLYISADLVILTFWMLSC